MNSLKQITVSDVEWELICEPEDDSPDGHFDDESDVEWVKEQIESGNEWGWCVVRLVGRFKGLQCWDVLGACSYQSERSFRECEYFADMQLEVLRQLQEEASNIAEFFAD